MSEYPSEQELRKARLQAHRDWLKRVGARKAEELLPGCTLPREVLQGSNPYVFKQLEKKVRQGWAIESTHAARVGHSEEWVIVIYLPAAMPPYRILHTPLV